MDDAILSALFNRGEHNVIQLTNELKLFLVFFPAMPMPSRGLEIDWFGISIKNQNIIHLKIANISRWNE